MIDYIYKGTELIKPLKVGELKYIVVGTGRCGTVYMAKLLTSVGIPCGHEAIFLHDGFDSALDRINNKEKVEISLIAKLASCVDENSGVSWFKDTEPPPLSADSSYMAAPYIDRPELDGVKIIHVVREPMKVINSFVQGFEYFRDNVPEEHKVYHEFIYQNVPELRDSMDPLSRAALYYVRWNEMIEEKSKKRDYFRFRVESDTHKLMKFLGKKNSAEAYNNRNSNHKLLLEDKYTKIEQIESLKARNLLAKIYNKYYCPSI